LVLGFVLVVLLGSASPALALNQPPVADAGEDQTMFLTESTMLEGSATDPDGDAIELWFWTIESKPLGSHPGFGPTTSPTPSFVPDVLGDYVFSLIVTDGQAASLPDEVTVHVIENLPPTAVAAADVTSGPAPLTVNFDGSGSFDPEGGALAYDWTFGDGFAYSSDESPPHTYNLPGIYTVRLIVFDDWDQPDADTILITVTAAADSDGDGVPDTEDQCPSEDATGFDSDGDGCIDTTASLTQIITTLPDDVLSDETKNSLASKVENAQKSADKEKADTAINQLNAFINEIQAQRGKKKSPRKPPTI
jgi:PKD repeat protein